MEVKRKDQSCENGQDKIYFRQSFINEKFQIVDEKATQETKHHKQKNQKKIPEGGSKKEKDKIKTTRRSKKEKNDKVQKETKYYKVVKSKTKNLNAAVPTKTILMKNLRKINKRKNNFSTTLSNLEKKLDNIHNLDGLKLVCFMIYLLVKEKQIVRKERQKLSNTSDCEHDVLSAS